ncbi:MAG: M48 family metalloprotease [Pseudonocardiaceae bacterium]|nr:M48 family metalloprotease [Pseudonocardiaceae bacterium]
MTAFALALLALGALLAEPVSRVLAAARWPARDPVGALVLWQAVGLAGGLALLGAGVVAGLAPLGESLPAALAALPHVGPLSAVHWGVLAVTALVASRLLGVLVLLTVRTLWARRRHRELLDVLATPWPGTRGARVLDHPLPVAYCLPGLRRSRLVVSAGALDALPPAELVAVLVHERAHLAERHDLVVLPFVAWGATAPFVPGMARAQAAVAALVEMRADDLARGTTGDGALAAALQTVAGAGQASEAALTSFSAATATRRARAQRAPDPLPAVKRLAVRAAALVLVAVPTAVLLLS